MKPHDILLQALRDICWNQDPDAQVAQLDHDLLLSRVKKLTPVRGLKTMGVGRVNGVTQLAYDPDFILSRTELLPAVLRHEAEHLLTSDDRKILEYQSGHLPDPTGLSLTHQQTAKLFNLARDCQINDKLEDHGVTFPADLQTCSGRRQLGQEVLDLTVEEVMCLIAEQNDWESQQPLEDLLGALAVAGQPAQPGDEPGEGQPVRVDLGPSGKPTGPTDKPAGGPKPGEGAGQPASIQPVPASVRWDNLLREFLDTRKVVETWQRRPKRTLSRTDILMPSRRPQPRKRGLIAIDVSGSVRQDLVARTVGLVKASPSNYDLEVILFNSLVHPWPDFRHTELPVVGGGTSFEAIEEHCRAQRRYPDAVIVLSDGEGHEFECEHKDRWLWLLYDTYQAAPADLWGMKAVSIEEKIL